MAETSLFWDTSSGTGDGSAAYTFQQFQQFLKSMFAPDTESRAVIPGLDNELAISATGTNRATIATGRALVNGTPYINDSNRELTIPSRTLTTVHSFILRWSRTAQTVRAAILAGSNGATTDPTLTRNNNTWEVRLARLSVTGGGTVTVTDQRDFLQWGADHIRDNVLGPDQMTDDIVRRHDTGTPYIIREMTQADYDALTNKSDTTAYFITG